MYAQSQKIGTPNLMKVIPEMCPAHKIIWLSNLLTLGVHDEGYS
jgi:hypothetical protein